MLQPESERSLSMAGKEQKYDAKYFIKVIIGLIIVWCFGFLPAPEPMTQVGMRLIGIFFGTIWLFSFAGALWPSIMAIIAAGYSGAFPSLSGAITAAFGNTILWQLLILMPICEAISRSGATQKMAAWLLSRPIVKGKPCRIMFALLLGTLLEGILISAMAAMLITFALVATLRDMIGYEKADAWSASTIVTSFIVAFLGGAALPFRGFIAAMVAPFPKMLGYDLNASLFVIASLVIGLLVCVIAPIIMKYVQRVNMDKLAAFDFAGFFNDDSKFNREQKILLSGFIVIIVFFVAQMIVPAKSEIGIVLNGFGANGIFALVAILLSLIITNGKPTIDLPLMMKEGMPWVVFVSVAAMVCITAKFTDDVSGISAWLNVVLGGLVGSMPPALFVFAAVLITVIVTSFFSNLGTAAIMLTAILPLCGTMGIEPSAMTCAIVLGSYLAVLSPGGSGACPVLFSNENVSYASIYKNAIPLLLVFTVLSSAMVLLVSFVA